MARYSSKERIGVQRFALLVEEHSDWIFREQTIADVGVDAIIEQTINGDPNGALIACQIKSGNGNFSTTKDGKLVYYISHIHREYWVNHDLPVILILVDDNGVIYWGLLNHNFIKKARLRFKTEIPKNQKLSPENINDVFERALHSKNLRNIVVDQIGDNDIDSIYDNIINLQFALNARHNIIKAFDDYSANMDVITDRFIYYRDKGVKENRKKINNQINKMATQHNMLGKRIENEIEVMAKGFTTSLLSTRKFFLKMGFAVPSNKLLILKNIFLEAHEIYTLAIKQHDFFHNTIVPDPKSRGSINFKELKKSEAYLSTIITLLSEELENVTKLTKMVLDALDDNF